MERNLKKAKSYNNEASSRLNQLLEIPNVHTEDVRNELESAADPNYLQDGYFLTKAIQNDREDLVRLLVDYGARVNASNKHTMFVPLIQATRNARTSNIVRFLLEKGANPNHISEISGTPLINLGRGMLFIESPQDEMDVYEALIEYGADLNLKADLDGRFTTALEAHISTGREDIVNFLIENGAKFKENNGVDFTGSIHINLALTSGYPKIAKLLIQRGVSRDLIREPWNYIIRHPVIYPGGRATENQVHTIFSELGDHDWWRTKSESWGTDVIRYLVFSYPNVFHYIVKNKLYNLSMFSDDEMYKLLKEASESEKATGETLEKLTTLSEVFLKGVSIDDCYKLGVLLPNRENCNHDVIFKSYSKNWGIGIELETELFESKSYKMKAKRFEKNYYSSVPEQGNIKIIQPDQIYGVWNISGIPISEMTDIVNLKLRKNRPLRENALGILEKASERKGLFGLAEPDWGIFGEYTEIITEKWKNQTVGLIMDQFSSYKREILRAMNRSKIEKGSSQTSVDQWANILEYPKSGSEVVYGRMRRSESDVYGERNHFHIKVVHTGSVHLNFTFPVVTRSELNEMKNFQDLINLHERKHYQVMRVLQWLGPLFVGVFGSASPISFGDSGMYSEGSTRIFGQDYSKFWSSDLSDGSNLITRNETLYNVQSDTGDIGIINYLARQKGTQFLGGAEFRRDPEKGNMFGFEWRIIDYLPDEYLKNVIECVIMCADHALNVPLDYDNMKQHMFRGVIFNMVADIFMEGWNTPLNLDAVIVYLDVLRLPELAIQFKQKHSDGPLTAFDLLDTIMNELFRRYGQTGRTSPGNRVPAGEMCKVFLRKPDGRYYTTWKLMNWNKKSWEYIFSKKGFLNGANKLRKKIQRDKVGVNSKSDLENFLGGSPPLRTFLKEDLDDLWEYLKSEGITNVN